jgi:hypothetical protein
MRVLFRCIYLFSLVLSACASSRDSAPTVRAIPVQASLQRFLPVSPPAQFVQGVPWHGFFALDTQTGQLCRTTILELGKEYMASVPTCYSLYAESAKRDAPQKE